MAQGSSMRIARCLLLTEPPSIDANEITDKGYLNQRAVLAKRAELVNRLHAALINQCQQHIECARTQLGAPPTNQQSTLLDIQLNSAET